MKLFKIFLLAIGLIAFNPTQAQVQPSTTATLPDWGVAGYDNARYYYIPDMESYYDINGRQFVYMNEGKWTKSTLQPSRFKEYDLYNSYKVVITDQKDPYADFDQMKAKYARGYKGDPQKTIKPKTINDNNAKIKEN